MSTRLSKTTSNTTDTELYEKLSKQISDQQNFINALLIRIQVLEDYVNKKQVEDIHSKSKQFVQESTPVNSTKTKPKSITNGSVNVSGTEYIEKVVPRNIFLKQLSTGCEFKYYIFQNEKHEHTWETLIDELELDFSSIKKMSSSHYHAIIEKLIGDHQENIDEDNETLKIAYLKNNTAQFKNTIFVLECKKCELPTNASVPEKSHSNTNPLAVNGNTKQSSSNGDICSDKEQFKSKFMFSKIEQFKIDDEDVLAEFSEEKITITSIYKKIIGNYSGRVTPTELFIRLADQLEGEGKVLYIVISKQKPKSDITEQFTYKTFTKSDDDECEQFSDEEDE